MNSNRFIKDIESVENRILVFAATKDNFDKLAKFDHWFTDRTIKIVEKSLQVRYRSVLAFVLKNDVIDALRHFVKNTWTGRPNKHRRWNPRFSISLFGPMMPRTNQN
ncbi:hypothetical protein FWK35_00004300 [Aphis craccivora]|uniref:Uncharacterized protein n=1 Tax=Aphis craccivora TaxID=307492 RepID=A0A6G0ZPL9_APHCR|nr:hypothetical protein FWK35_00004300 [Aphis craccivora]